MKNFSGRSLRHKFLVLILSVYLLYFANVIKDFLGISFKKVFYELRFGVSQKERVQINGLPNEKLLEFLENRLEDQLYGLENSEFLSQVNEESSVKLPENANEVTLLEENKTSIQFSLMAIWVGVTILTIVILGILLFEMEETKKIK